MGAENDISSDFSCRRGDVRTGDPSTERNAKGFIRAEAAIRSVHSFLVAGLLNRMKTSALFRVSLHDWRVLRLSLLSAPNQNGGLMTRSIACAEMFALEIALAASF